MLIIGKKTIGFFIILTLQFAEMLQDGDVSLPDSDRFDEGKDLFALERALGRGLLSQASPSWINTPFIYCGKEDSDCIDAYSVGSWSNTEGNYFVVGTRSDLPKREVKSGDDVYHLITLYTINDKLYLSGIGTGSDVYKPGEKRRTEWLEEG